MKRMLAILALLGVALLMLTTRPQTPVDQSPTTVGIDDEIDGDEIDGDEIPELSPSLADIVDRALVSAADQFGQHDPKTPAEQHAAANVAMDRLHAQVVAREAVTAELIRADLIRYEKPTLELVLEGMLDNVIVNGVKAVNSLFDDEPVEMPTTGPNGSPIDPFTGSTPQALSATLVVAATEFGQRNPEMLVDSLLHNEITEKDIIAAAKKGLDQLPEELRQALPAGFDEAFLEQYRRQVPGIRAHVKEIYLKVYTPEQLAVLYAINEEYPWVKTKGVEVTTKVMAFTTAIGREVGARVGRDLTAKPSRFLLPSHVTELHSTDAAANKLRADEIHATLKKLMADKADKLREMTLSERVYFPLGGDAALERLRANRIRETTPLDFNPITGNPTLKKLRSDSKHAITQLPDPY